MEKRCCNHIELPRLLPPLQRRYGVRVSPQTSLVSLSLWLPGLQVRNLKAPIFDTTSSDFELQPMVGFLPSIMLTIAKEISPAVSLALARLVYKECGPSLCLGNSAWPISLLG